MASKRPPRNAEERLAQVVELQRILSQVARDIGAGFELQPVLRTVLGAARALVDFRGGAIHLRDDRGLYIAAADPAEVTDSLTPSRGATGKGVAGRVVQTGRTEHSGDLRESERLEQHEAAPSGTERSYLAVPLFVSGEVIGAIEIDSVEDDAFGEEDVAVLEALAVHVAGAIESARRHELEAELERMKTDFIARISHELRTPLTIMSGFTDTLLSHGDHLDADQRAEVLERVKASIERLSAMIEEILSVASFEAGTTQVKLEDIQVRSVLEHVRDLSIDAPRVDVTCPDDLFVVTDVVILRHILNQLVDNALKYAGSARLTAARVDDGTLEITVSDTGPGIPRDDRQRVFQRFYRGNHTRPGMGLGLPVARDLSIRLGAALELDALPEGGSRFTIRFP